MNNSLPKAAAFVGLSLPHAYRALLGIQFVPALQSAGLQVRFGGGLPARRVGGFEQVPDGAFLFWFGDRARLVAPKSEP